MVRWRGGRCHRCFVSLLLLVMLMLFEVIDDVDDECLVGWCLVGSFGVRLDSRDTPKAMPSWPLNGVRRVNEPHIFIRIDP